MVLKNFGKIFFYFFEYYPSRQIFREVEVTRQATYEVGADRTWQFFAKQHQKMRILKFLHFLRSKMKNDEKIFFVKFFQNFKNIF